jgi:hypothetical protein
MLIASSVAALEGPRDTVEGPPPTVVFQGEGHIDISDIELTGGGTIGTDPVTLIGLRGDAEGTVETVRNPTHASFESIEQGTYDIDNDESPDIAVAEPRVTDIQLRLDNGVDVTDGRVQSGRLVTAIVDYNFDAADGVELEVRGPNGVVITPQSY